MHIYEVDNLEISIFTLRDLEQMDFFPFPFQSSITALFVSRFKSLITIY